MADAPIIVPVSLKNDEVPKSNRQTEQRNSLACQVRAKDLEIRIFNGADPAILAAVMKEVRHAR